MKSLLLYNPRSARSFFCRPGDTLPRGAAPRPGLFDRAESPSDARRGDDSAGDASPRATATDARPGLLARRGDGGGSAVIRKGDPATWLPSKLTEIR